MKTTEIEFECMICCCLLLVIQDTEIIEYPTRCFLCGNTRKDQFRIKKMKGAVNNDV